MNFIIPLVTVIELMIKDVYNSSLKCCSYKSALNHHSQSLFKLSIPFHFHFFACVVWFFFQHICSCYIQTSKMKLKFTSHPTSDEAQSISWCSIEGMLLIRLPFIFLSSIHYCYRLSSLFFIVSSWRWIVE